MCGGRWRREWRAREEEDGVDGVYIVLDGSGSHAPIGGEDPREEEAAARGGSGGVLGGFLRTTGGDDGMGIMGIMGGGGEVGGYRRGQLTVKSMAVGCSARAEVRRRSALV